jgi:hypothetical protein
MLLSDDVDLKEFIKPAEKFAGLVYEGKAGEKTRSARPYVSRYYNSFSFTHRKRRHIRPSPLPPPIPFPPPRPLPLPLSTNSSQE